MRIKKSLYFKINKGTNSFRGTTLIPRLTEISINKIIAADNGALGDA